MSFRTRHLPPPTGDAWQRRQQVQEERRQRTEAVRQRERERLAALVAADERRARDREEARREAQAAAFEERMKAQYLSTGASEQDWARDRDAVLREARIEVATGREPALPDAVAREKAAMRRHPLYRARLDPTDNDRRHPSLQSAPLPPPHREVRVPTVEEETAALGASALYRRRIDLDRIPSVRPQRATD